MGGPLEGDREVYKVGEGGICFRCRNNSSFRLKSLGSLCLRHCLLVSIGSGGRTKESKTGAEQQCQCGVKRENKQEDYIVGGNETTVSSPTSSITFTAWRMALDCRLQQRHRRKQDGRLRWISDC